MKHVQLLFLLLLAGLGFYQSCDEPNFEMEDYQSKIVIDGWIEQGKFPQVLLTLSAPYFSDIDSASLRDYALTRAKATISNGEVSEVLTLKPNNVYFPPYLYIGTSIKGEVGKTYTLTVEYAGIKAMAITTIPVPVTLDSVWFALEPNQDSLGLLWLKFTDPVEAKNYYRTLTQVKNKDTKYIPTYFPNFNDEYFNGQEISVSLYKGNKISTNKEDELYYTLGDTIMLKATSIDKNSFEFWKTFQKEIINTGNPFASNNARVKSNVTNGLGIWCGYGSTYYQVIAR
ncbi:MAG: DUF4249 domain-containing protein [Salinivirgaceae bacterium]|jgi:hypothetical protein